jgi:hypothetical protein
MDGPVSGLWPNPRYIKGKPLDELAFSVGWRRPNQLLSFDQTWLMQQAPGTSGSNRLVGRAEVRKD